MTPNPYEPPHGQLPARSVMPGLTPDELLDIVRAHRGMMWLAVGKMAIDAMFFTVSSAIHPPTFYLYGGLSLAILIGCAYFVFRLAKGIFGAGPAIACVLLMLAPCMGTLTILVLSGNTIDFLRKRGVKVGLMGANKLQLRELENAVEMER